MNVYHSPKQSAMGEINSNPHIGPGSFNASGQSLQSELAEIRLSAPKPALCGNTEAINKRKISKNLHSASLCSLSLYGIMMQPSLVRGFQFRNILMPAIVCNNHFGSVWPDLVSANICSTGSGIAPNTFFETTQAFGGLFSCSILLSSLLHGPSTLPEVGGPFLCRGKRHACFIIHLHPDAATFPA